MKARILTLALALGAALLAVVPAAHAVGGEGEAWPAFTESSGCGAQRMSPPHTTSPGWLYRDELLRGEAASFFGRTVREVQESLVRWTIPGSVEQLAVHPTMLPALEEAEAVIVERLKDGDRYRIRPSSTFSAAARTIAGQVRISRHTFGTAFDINAHANPYRGDNKFISDMPDWWVDAFLDAGFCWGGLWIGSKDTMHFAWQGPAFSGVDSLPLPYAPLTEAAPLGPVDASIFVTPRPLPNTVSTVLADADGNGAIDVVRLSTDGSDVIIDASVASRRHNACSARRSIAPDLARRLDAAITSGFGDWDGRGGQDLWLVEDSGGNLALTVRWAFGGYTAETSVTTGVPVPSAGAWISSADVDADGSLDLVIVDDDDAYAWSIDPSTGATSLLFTRPNPTPGAETYMLGDYDLDNLPDLWSISNGVVSTALAADAWSETSVRQVPGQLPANIVDSVIADYDGDGRRDLIVFDGWSKRVWLGNTRLPDGLPMAVWFEHPEPDCDENEASWDRQELRFSTSGWVAEGSYEWRTKNGLPAGCNPEENDCAVGTVSNRAFSEFLAWIDGLAATTTTDDAAGRALIAAGYNAPCDLEDTECWERPMLRADISAHFGLFLSQRRGDVPQPHRWFLKTPLPEPPVVPQ